MTLESLHFRVGEIVFITVPSYFVTDLASIPKWARGLISKTDDHIRAAIVHDYLIDKHMVSRAAADGLFFDLLTADGLCPWKRWAMYFAVRFGAFLPWSNNPPPEILEEANRQIKIRKGHS